LPFAVKFFGGANTLSFLHFHNLGEKCRSMKICCPAGQHKLWATGCGMEPGASEIAGEIAGNDRFGPPSGNFMLTLEYPAWLRGPFALHLYTERGCS